MEGERNQRILDMYLQAVNTQESIAEVFGLPRESVRDIIKKVGENSESAKTTEDFKPYLYNNIL